MPAARRRRGVVGAADEAAAKSATAVDRIEKEQKAASNKSRARRGSDNTPAAYQHPQALTQARSGLDSAQGARRKQLLLWRDTMLDAQRMVSHQLANE